MPQRQVTQDGQYRVGDRVRLIAHRNQEGSAVPIGTEFDIVNIDRNSSYGEFVRGEIPVYGRLGFYLRNIENVAPTTNVPTEIEARLDMYRSIPVPTTAVKVIIEELEWILAAVKRFEASRVRAERAGTAEADNHDTVTYSGSGDLFATVA